MYCDKKSSILRNTPEIIMKILSRMPCLIYLVTDKKKINY